jgi:hypothetical protein
MTDKELLELAAKAAGDEVEIDHQGVFHIHEGSGPQSWRPWNPLTDDGDNARLEAALGLNVLWGSRAVSVGRKFVEGGPAVERYADHGDDKQKARRRAAVRAAAFLAI